MRGRRFYKEQTERETLSDTLKASNQHISSITKKTVWRYMRCRLLLQLNMISFYPHLVKVNSTASSLDFLEMMMLSK